ncbi:MAG: DUF481 domain-containing protein [Pirellulales bacterium]
MKGRTTKPGLALWLALACGAIAAAEEPPSSVWSPPSPDPATAADPTPAVGDLPAPQGNEGNKDAVIGGPWLLGEEAFEEGDSEWYQPNYWFGITPWDTGIELGVNGSAGNNEAFSIRTGGYMKRESRFSKLDYSIYYNRTTTAGLTTQNNATSDIRNDWMLDDSSPWTLYAKANVFYDEFQAFDLQTNGNSGIGYQIFKDPKIELTTRAGAGASREFGGPDNEWTPEALFGFEYLQHVSATQKFYANFEYYPAMEGFDEYRIVTDGGWEIEFSKPSNLSLKLSASDRYDSTSFGADPNLLNYSVLLLLKL